MVTGHLRAASVERLEVSNVWSRATYVSEVWVPLARIERESHMILRSDLMGAGRARGMKPLWSQSDQPERPFVPVWSSIDQTHEIRATRWEWGHLPALKPGASARSGVPHPFAVSSSARAIWSRQLERLDYPVFLFIWSILIFFMGFLRLVYEVH